MKAGFEVGVYSARGVDKYGSCKHDKDLANE